MPASGANRGWISLEERIRGCILGGAIGDALGAPVEFDGIDEIRRRFGANGVTGYAGAYGRTGAITDDTQMALFTLHGLIQAGRRQRGRGIVSVPSVLDRAYAQWLGTQGEQSRRWPGGQVGQVGQITLFSDMEPDAVAALNQLRAPGNTCLTALRADRMGTIEEPLNDSKGCGAVMRIAPVGLIGASDTFDLGCDIAAITHGHPSGYLAAGALAELIAGICHRQMPLEQALDCVQLILRRRWRHEEVLEALLAARSLASSDIAPGPGAIAGLGGGWVAEEALAIAVYCASVAEDFAHGVLLAVNHSGDSDSTGALTGNILGAQLGHSALPGEWLEGLELRDTGERLCGDFISEFFASPADDSSAGAALPPE